MPITKSAKKAIRAAGRKKVLNDRRRRALKEAIKRIGKLAKAGQKAEAKKLLPTAYQVIDKAVKRGIIKLNNAARKKSRLARLTK